MSHANTLNAPESGVGKSEIVKSLAERPVPPMDELFENFDQKRNALQSRVDELNGHFGGTLNAVDMMELRKQRKDAEAELDDFNSVWSQIGGSEVDAAQAHVDDLNFRSTAIDHVDAKGELSRAKERAYENFITLHDEVHGSESNSSNEVSKRKIINVVDEGEPAISNDEKAELSQDATEQKIQTKRAQMVGAGVKALDVGNMSDEEVKNYRTPEKTIETEDQVEDASRNQSDEGKSGRNEDSSERPADDSFEKKQIILSAEELSLLESIIDKSKKGTIIFQEDLDKLASITDRLDTEVAQGDGSPAEKSSLSDEEVQTRREKLKQIREEIDKTSIGQTLKRTLDSYATRKADFETKGGLIGRKKRQEMLKAAEKALFEAHNLYTMKLLREQQEAGWYENMSNAEANQQKSDDYFNELRTLDTKSREATHEMRLSRIENRSVLQKGLAGVGKFLNGGKGRGWLRNAGPGVLAGMGVALSGAAWPITTAFTLGAGIGVRQASKMDILDKSLDGYKTSVMSDEEFNEHVARAKENSVDLSEDGREIAQKMFNASRVEGSKHLKAARDKARKNATKFSAGALAGAVTAGAFNKVLSGSEASATDHAVDGGTHEDGAAKDAYNGSPEYKMPDGADAPTPNAGEAQLTTGEDIMLPDTDKISIGEGFKQQFSDMGYSQDQVKSLVADKNLMNDLVKQGVAYVDNSSTIGGYGINMPANGRLSEQAMETIRAAAVAKGY